MASVLLREIDLTQIVESEFQGFFTTLFPSMVRDGGIRHECFGCPNLALPNHRFDSGSMADVRAGEGNLANHRIHAECNRSSMQADAQVHLRGQVCSPGATLDRPQQAQSNRSVTTRIIEK